MRWFVRRGLRVLMYHKVSLSKRDALTVSRDQLKTQLEWLRAEGFPFVTAKAVIADLHGQSSLPENSVLVTFDDAYVDTFELARPILRQLGIPAVVFVPTAFVGETTSWDEDPLPVMSAAHLRKLADEGWELGLHSHRHLNYRTLSSEEIAGDLHACVRAAASLSLPTVLAFAYPYGGRPQGGESRRRLREDLAAVGFQIAFRIGGRVNPLPLRDQLEINRLGVRGDKDFGHFQRQVWWGRIF